MAIQKLKPKGRPRKPEGKVLHKVGVYLHADEVKKLAEEANRLDQPSVSSAIRGIVRRYFGANKK